MGIPNTTGTAEPIARQSAIEPCTIVPACAVIAAAAEAVGLSVHHHDGDYDRIAAVTNQPTEWIAPAGTLG